MTSSAGPLLRQWRELRRISQLELSALSGVSAKHISYVETGRSRPSREMVLHLAVHLDIPLRNRNEILFAAGHAPAYTERPLDTPEGKPTLGLLETIVDAQRYPAMVVDARWNLVAANDAAWMLTGEVADHLLQPPINLLRLTLHPEGLAPAIANLGDYAAHLVQRLQRLGTMRWDDDVAELLDRAQAAAASGCSPARAMSATSWGLTLPLMLRLDGTEVAFVSTIATFGAPRDVVVAELAIESLVPADDTSRAFLDAFLARDRRSSERSTRTTAVTDGAERAGCSPA